MARGRQKALARAAQLAAAPAGDAPSPPRLAPLKCASCDAPVPLGQDDTATCTFCHAAVPLPAEYRELRDAEQQRTADRDRAEQLYRELGSPPSAALRIWARFAAVATTALFGAVVALLTVCASLMLLAGFALELVLHALAPLIRIDLIDRFGGGTVYAGFIVIIVVGALLPIWAFSYFDSLAEIKRSLQANLAAIPPQKPGFPSTCRECGAALDVPPGAYGVRCAYVAPTTSSRFRVNGSRASAPRRRRFIAASSPPSSSRPSFAPTRAPACPRPRRGAWARSSCSA